jgi:predicted ATP-grasp superfamily ATP-dependent carboligase
MRSTVVADLNRMGGVEAYSLPPGADEPRAFQAAAQAADYALIIAPEFDALLETRCRWVEEAGGQLLGPSASAVQLTGDKLALAALLHACGVPTPPCQTSHASLSFPLVLKPRFGAGSQATFLLREPGDLSECLKIARNEGWQGEMVFQPFCPGTPASVAFLVGPKEIIPLPPASQLLSKDGRFRYQGGRIPLPPDLAERSVRIACQAVAAVPGLRGYVGVDLVLGPAADGSQDQVIEINPRLTTSYVGLRALARTNLAEAMLRVVQGQEVDAIQWRSEIVEFHPDGRIQALPGPG